MTTKERLIDANNKLGTVYAILTEMERRGNYSVRIELVMALLQATRATLEEAEINDGE